MHEANLWSHLGGGFESKGYERADVAADRPEWDTAGREVGRVQLAFASASSDGNDTAEGGTALE